MSRWNDIRQLASIIEAEAEGRLIDRERAVALARQLATRHPQIQASMALVVERLAGPVPVRPTRADAVDDPCDVPTYFPGVVFNGDCLTRQQGEGV